MHPQSDNKFTNSSMNDVKIKRSLYLPPKLVFSRIMCVSFTITLRQRPKGVARSRRSTGSLSLCDNNLFYLLKESKKEIHTM